MAQPTTDGRRINAAQGKQSDLRKQVQEVRTSDKISDPVKIEQQGLDFQRRVKGRAPRGSLVVKFIVGIIAFLTANALFYILRYY